MGSALRLQWRALRRDVRARATFKLSHKCVAIVCKHIDVLYVIGENRICFILKWTTSLRSTRAYPHPTWLPTTWLTHWRVPLHERHQQPCRRCSRSSTRSAKCLLPQVVRAPLHAKMTFDGRVPRYGIIYSITPPSPEADCAASRPRENGVGDLDPSSREAKRASPPSEKEKERPARKSGSDARAQGTPMSPKSNSASALCVVYISISSCVC